MLFYFHKIDFAYTLADDKAKLIKNSFQQLSKSQITHFFCNPEKIGYSYKLNRVRFFLPYSSRWKHSLPCPSHGLQLSQIGGYGFAFDNVYRSDTVYNRTMATCTVVFETKDTLSFGVIPTILKVMLFRWQAGSAHSGLWRGTAGDVLS